MKKRIFYIMIAVLAITAVGIFSCQKDEVLTNPGQGMLLKSGGSDLSPVVTEPTQTCDDCISADGSSDPTITQAFYNKNFYVTVAISNTATDLIYSFNSNTSLKYIQFGDYELCSDVNLTLPYVVEIPLPEGWEACQEITTTITTNRNNCNNTGSGDMVTFDAPHTLIGICDPSQDIASDNCIWMVETAWATGTRYVTKGNWGTYTSYDDEAESVILVAGQTMEAGTVDFSVPDNDGNVTITITLNDGWRFRDVAENVKIQDYSGTPPAENPNPGSFDTKGDASGSPFSIVVPGNNYYGVHVDVEREDCQQQE